MFTLGNGRFSLIKELGHGATASVHLATDHLRNTTCAIKILAPSYIQSPDALLRMKREFQALSKLEDHRIIQIHEIFEDPPFIMMDFIDGQGLDQWNATYGLMPEHLILALGKTLSATLINVHKQGVIHRDIKPSNILIRPDNTPVIVDFGMMRVEDGAVLTATGIAIGTMGYIAPEQLSNAKTADQRCDVFSLGITLLCLATGLPPVSATKLLEQCGDKLSPQLLTVLMRATLENPSMRTASMEDVHKQLCRIPLPPLSSSQLHIPRRDSTPLHLLKTLSLPPR